MMILLIVLGWLLIGFLSVVYIGWLLEDTVELGILIIFTCFGVITFLVAIVGTIDTLKKKAIWDKVIFDFSKKNG